MTKEQIHDIKEQFIKDLFTNGYAGYDIEAEKGYKILYRVRITKECNYQLRRDELFGEKENGSILRPCFLETDSDEMLNSLLLELRTDLERYC